MQSITDLQAAIGAITSETVANANTAARVGGAMGGLLGTVAVTGAINVRAVTGQQSFDTVAAMAAAITTCGLPADSLVPGVLALWMDAGGTLHAARLKGANAATADAWETVPLDYHDPVVQWSGTVVTGVTVSYISVPETSDPARVVYDTGRGTFLYNTTGSTYINNWTTRTDYQSEAYTATSGDSFVAGFRRAFFAGQDGSLWIATSDSSLFCLVAAQSQGGGGDAYPVCRRWSGTVVTSPTLAVTSAVGDEPAAVVYDSGRNTFLYFDGDEYHTNWTTRTDYQSGDYSLHSAGPFNPQFAKAFFPAIDGTLWAATSADTLERVAGEDNGGVTTFAGIYAGSDIVSDTSAAASPSASLWYIRQSGQFGIGVVEEVADTWIDGTPGFKRFRFRGKTGLTNADLEPYGPGVVTSMGYAVAEDGVELVQLPPVDTADWQGRGMRYRASRTSLTTCELIPLFRLSPGDMLLDDGTFIFVDALDWNYPGLADRVRGIIVDTARRLMIPVPAAAVSGKAFVSSRGTSMLAGMLPVLKSLPDCRAVDAYLYSARASLGGTDASFDTYFPAFYEARFGQRAGYKRYLATRDECTAIGADSRITRARELCGLSTDPFYGITPREQFSVTAAASVQLEGDAAAGNAVTAATASTGAKYAVLALYND